LTFNCLKDTTFEDTAKEEIQRRKSDNSSDLEQQANQLLRNAGYDPDNL